MPSSVQKAEAFRALHHERHPLILPNAWDVPSARIFENAGFRAVATSSAGLLVSLGYPDGETIPRRELVAAVGRIARRLSVPLSADVVAGFGRTPREVATTVRAIVKAGAVGVNIEDSQPNGRGLCSVALQRQKIEEIRRVGESTGVPLVINARTDALHRAPGDRRDRLGEATRRSLAYRDAGADCVYPMGLTDAGSIGAFVQAVDCPVNVMIRQGLPGIMELERLGVKRVSFGPAASYAAMGLLRRASEEVLTRGTYTALLEGAITHDELNQLAIPRARQKGRGV
jgi:2-methylisocitrate lyase-like PEP mutase family enzyme